MISVADFGEGDGSGPLKRRRAVFVGTARNCDRELPLVLKNIERLASLYAEAAFVFAVSDSDDDTLQTLRRWMASGRRGRVLDLGRLEPTAPFRTVRLAISRNACLEEARSAGLGDHEHLVVCDMDNVMAPSVSPEAFASAAQWLDREPLSAGVFANSTPRYYDIWALRHDRWSPYDCWHAIWHRPTNRAFEAAKIKEVFVRQVHIPAWLPPIQVESAFGGLGIYKLSYALNATYKGTDGTGRQSSEHVHFNEQIRDAGGRLFVFPSLIVHAPPEHLYRRCDFTFRWQLRMRWQGIFGWPSEPWRSAPQPS